MKTVDQTPQLNTDVQQPPRLWFLQRFIYDFGNKETIEVERQTTGPLMTPLMSAKEREQKMLSPIAKMNPDDTPMYDERDRLPPMDVTHHLIEQEQHRQPVGTAPTKNPMKLAAVGRVNGMQIFLRAGQPGEIVSRKVTPVP